MGSQVFSSPWAEIPCGRTKSISHHFETMVETIAFVAICVGESTQKPGFLSSGSWTSQPSTKHKQVACPTSTWPASPLKKKSHGLKPKARVEGMGKGVDFGGRLQQTEALARPSPGGPAGAWRRENQKAEAWSRSGELALSHRSFFGWEGEALK